MNIVKIGNIGKITSFNNKLEINSNIRVNDKTGIMVILSDDDVINENSLIKLRGTVIDILILPKKYKFTFNDTKTGQLIKLNYNEKIVISYY